MGTGRQRGLDPYANERVAEFLALVNVAALRESPADGRVDIANPDSRVWERRDDLALDIAAVKSAANRWTVLDDAGVYRLTERGRGAYEQANPHLHPLFGRAAAATPTAPSAPSMSAPAAPTARTMALLTFAPTAPGPSWMLDLDGLDYLDLRRMLSIAQRAELHDALANAMRALEAAGAIA